jgi:CRISPR-associated protein Cas1
MTQSGRFLARVVGEVRGNVTLLKTQYRLSDNENQSTQIAKSFIVGKIYNAKWVIESTTRDYAELDTAKLKKVFAGLSDSLERGVEALKNCVDMRVKRQACILVCLMI